MTSRSRPPRHSRHRSSQQDPPSSGSGTQSFDQDVEQHQQEPPGRSGRFVRPGREEIGPDHRHYNYYKHAQAAKDTKIYPSTTGDAPARRKDGHAGEKTLAKRKKNTPQNATPPSLWSLYCALITFWCPNAVLKCFGKRERSQQDAWREKMGLISIILSICAIVGFLTFGFTETVCPSNSSVRLRVNHVSSEYMIFHGKAYNLSSSRHPQVRGIPKDANVLYSLPTLYGGQDGSFLFQNVNGACKGLITAVPGSAVPTNSKGELGWYFPCNTFSQDGSTTPEDGIDGGYYGYACHTSSRARNDFYSMRPAGDVYYTWGDIRNSSRNLIVWGGDVIDLNLLQWFNTSEVSIPTEFEKLRQTKKFRGTDVTRSFSSSRDRHVARCLTEIAKVGSVDTETIGCIASQVVLYVSLIFILSIVLVKFLLALIFQWILCRKFNPPKMEALNDASGTAAARGASKSDIYTAPVRHDPMNPEQSNRTTWLPKQSRFSNLHGSESSKSTPLTMAMIAATQPSNQNTHSMYRQLNQSNGSVFPDAVRGSMLAPPAPSALRTSMLGSDGEVMFPKMVHEQAILQPPPEYQPFGFPLAHTICLVTAYSEDEAGLRTTLDSIAATKYPNSHKLILVICDGLITGQGQTQSTPDVVLGMLSDSPVHQDDVQPYSYVAVATGTKRHNMAKVYTGFYHHTLGDPNSTPSERAENRVPMMVVVKCGTPDEVAAAKAQPGGKPGNRGKRDSQIILMSFLQKVIFGERMTELEYEIFRGISYITGISPDYYEIVLMVDADTCVNPESLTHMVSAMVKDPEIMGLCGETEVDNKLASWVSAIQVFEYFVSHHLSKSFESVFGGVTCLPGCFCMYRIKAPKGGQNYWVPILANPDIVEHYSENVVDTLHKKNLLLLGEDRYLTTLMLKTFPKRKQVFVPQAICKTVVPDEFKVLLSQRRRWINSTVHNLMELVLVRDLCGTFCFSMQFVIFIELVGTLVLPAAISFTIYLIAISIKAAIVGTAVPVIPLILLGLILGLPAFLIVLTAKSVSYVGYMIIYLFSLPVWNFILPTYAYWKFDDFSWGDTRKTVGEKKSGSHDDDDVGEFDSSKITMRRWQDFEIERRNAAMAAAATSTHAYPSEY